MSGTGEWLPSDVSGTIGECVYFCGAAPSGDQIAVRCGRRDSTGVKQLLGNAIDALPAQGGRILIRSRDATEWKNGSVGVVLTLADMGTGMSAHTLEKLFDAFFTTKGIGGTGLGLWISSQLV